MPITNIPELETELRFFEERRVALVAKAKGKYALVKGDLLAGTFEDRNEAIGAGYEPSGISRPGQRDHRRGFPAAFHARPLTN